MFSQRTSETGFQKTATLKLHMPSGKAVVWATRETNFHTMTSVQTFVQFLHYHQLVVMEQ